MGRLLSVVGMVTAVVILLVAIAIALIPRILYKPLPRGISLNFTKPTTIVVTGANSGLGLATVQNFAHNQHARIIMACRSQSKCVTAMKEIYDNLHDHGDDVVKAELRPMILDLSKKSSIEAFAKELRNEPIDILIHNAGLAGATKDLTYDADEDGVENHIRVNHLGSFYLTHCLWKNLQIAKHGARVVLVSSVLGGPASSIPTFGWYKDEPRFTRSWNIKMYGCSKRANLFFANELHHRYKDSTSISVTAAHPGMTQTSLCKNGCKGKNSAISRYISNLELLTGIIKMTPQEGSLSQAYAAVLPKAGLYVGPSLLIIGEPKILGPLHGSWHHKSFTRGEGKILWDKSMKAMGIKVFGEFGETNHKKVSPPPPPPKAPKASKASKSSKSPPVEESWSSSSSSEDEEDKKKNKKAISEDSSDEDSSEDEEEEKIWNTYLGDGDYKEAVVM